MEFYLVLELGLAVFTDKAKFDLVERNMKR